MTVAAPRRRSTSVSPYLARPLRTLEEVERLFRESCENAGPEARVDVAEGRGPAPEPPG